MGLGRISTCFLRAHHLHVRRVVRFGTMAGKLELKSPVPSDIEIAQSVEPREISAIARDAGILDSELEPYGRDAGKVSLDVLERLTDGENGSLVVVAGINPST